MPKTRVHLAVTKGVRGTACPHCRGDDVCPHSPGVTCPHIYTSYRTPKSTHTTPFRCPQNVTAQSNRCSRNATSNATLTGSLSAPTPCTRSAAVLILLVEMPTPQEWSSRSVSTAPRKCLPPLSLVCPHPGQTGQARLLHHKATEVIILELRANTHADQTNDTLSCYNYLVIFCFAIIKKIIKLTR